MQGGLFTVEWGGCNGANYIRLDNPLMDIGELSVSVQQQLGALTCVDYGVGFSNQVGCGAIA